MPQKCWEWKKISCPEKPGHQNVIIEVKAASLNHIDLWLGNGYGNKLFEKLGVYPPFVLGRDGSGIIKKVGSSVWNYLQGQEVIFAVHPTEINGGTFANYIEIPQWYIARKPPNLSFEQSAGLPYAGLTGWSALVKYGGVGKNEKKTVLVHGGAGAVGFLAIQYLNAIGCSVVTTCKSKDLQRLVDLKVGEVVDIENEDYGLLLNGFGPYDVILDCSPVTQRAHIENISIPLLHKGGHFITLNGDFIRSIDESPSFLSGLFSGSTEGTIKKINYFKNYGIHYHWGLFQNDANGLQEISCLAEAGKIIPHTPSVYQAKDFKKALEDYESNKAKKIVFQFDVEL
uniref:Enoyl reductase (ER) domain-containing protein n=1 Tax=Arcella intermedia TaxID=1963864 RepID=A0A6B2L906_9EUKA